MNVELSTNRPRRSLERPVLAESSLLALAVWLSLSLSCRPHPAAPVHLVLLHTNDIHGQVLPRNLAVDDAHAPRPTGGLARLASEIRTVREREPHVIAVDAGDWSQGTPEGALDAGLGFLRALAAIGFEALCVGNHDLDHGIAELRKQLDASPMPVVLANVRERSSGARVTWASPWRTVEVGGIRVALVGLLTPATPRITHSDAQGLDFVDPALELTRVRSELGTSVDLIVPVAHLGLEEARRLARAHPDLPLIVSGHSHDSLPEGVREGETLIVQAGSRTAELGRVDLWVDSARKVRATATLVPLDREPAPEWRVVEVERICAELSQRTSEHLAEVVGELESPALRKRSLGSSSAGNWICDAMRAHCFAEVALHNKGGTRSDLPAGPVTRRDLYEFLPFENELVVLRMTGRELHACIRRAVENTAHKGFDFSGLEVFVHRDGDGAIQLSRILVRGHALEPAREYRVVTNTFLAEGGSGSIELAQAERVRVEPIGQRALMEMQLTLLDNRRPPTDERVIVLESAVGVPIEASAGR